MADWKEWRKALPWNASNCIKFQIKNQILMELVWGLKLNENVSNASITCKIHLGQWWIRWKCMQYLKKDHYCECVFCNWWMRYCDIAILGYHFLQSFYHRPRTSNCPQCSILTWVTWINYWHLLCNIFWEKVITRTLHWCQLVTSKKYWIESSAHMIMWRAGRKTKG